MILDYLQLALLAFRQVLRCLAEDEGRALDFLRFLAGSCECGSTGIILFRTPLAVLPELSHFRLRVAPCFAPHFVERVHASFHDVEGIDASGGVRKVLLNARRDPLCAIRCHGLDGGTLLFCQALHELGDNVFPVAFSGPYDSVCIVVHDDGDVLVPLAVARLVDADVDKAVEPFACVWFKMLVSAMDAAPDRVPFDAHVRSNSALAQLERHPRHDHVERLREAGTRERPRDAGSVDTMLEAANARQAVAQVDENAVVVQSTPQTRLGLRMVISRATLPADGAEMLFLLVWAQIDDDALRSVRTLVQGDVFHDRVVDIAENLG